MTSQIKEYIAQTDVLLSGEGAGVDWAEQISHHLVMTRFFQHERLVHLLVTALFAILTARFILYAAAAGGLAAYVLVAVTLVLLAFYIRHYFFLENRVQLLYKQYIRLRERAAEVHSKQNLYV